MMRSTLLSISLLALSVGAGFIGELNLNQRAPLPTAFSNPIGKRQDVLACSAVYSAINVCELLNPGFTTAGVEDQAICLCYEGTSWRPSGFDGQIKTCANYAKTVDPDSYSSIVLLNGFCTSVGDVLVNAVTESSTTSRELSNTGIGSMACSIVSVATSFCYSVSPGFTNMPVSDQAPCLCYDSTTWSPGVFDGVVETCIDYASTALPSVYSDILSYQEFCTSVGDVLGPATNSASTTESPTTSRTRSTTTSSSGILTSSRPTGAGPTAADPTGLLRHPPCSYISSALAYCESISPGYLTMEPSSQAPCACYTSGTWVPDTFDRSALSCADFVKTEQPTDYSAFSALAGFCTDVGDIFAQTTSSGGSSSGSSETSSLGGLGSDLNAGTSTTPFSTSVQAASTVTVVVPPSAATTSSTNSGGKDVLVSHGAVKLVIVLMVLLV